MTNELDFTDIDKVLDNIDLKDPLGIGTKLDHIYLSRHSLERYKEKFGNEIDIEKMKEAIRVSFSKKIDDVMIGVTFKTTIEYDVSIKVVLVGIITRTRKGLLKYSLVTLYDYNKKTANSAEAKKKKKSYIKNFSKGYVER